MSVKRPTPPEPPLQRARAALERLDFNFASFSIEKLVPRVERFTGRRLHLAGRPLPQTVDGLWLTDPERGQDFVIFNNDLPPRRQLHAQLHEIAHILLDHPTATVGSIQRLDFAQVAFRQREEHDSPQEVEAELLALLMRTAIGQTSAGDPELDEQAYRYLSSLL